MRKSTHKKQNSTDGSNVVASMVRTDAAVARAWDVVKKCILIFGVFGVFGVVVLTTLAVAALDHGSVSSFMWVRASILLLITPVFYRLAEHASRGEEKSFERLRTVSVIVPIAIVGVDLIPGVCPTWYAAMQAASAVPLVAIAVITRRAAKSARSAGGTDAS
ncbi:MAG TPA: hypothetical protein VFH54_10375 [Mycobacteriales bacterium]|nr:hypothetical protein [Mycobacteriales bacterium]